MDDRILIMIFDGVGDRPVKELNDQTPLEAADTPNLDKAALEGTNGLMDTIGPGIIPGSDTGHLAILGYDPYEVYLGRGPFEAAGIDMELEPGEVAFRCNFSTIEDGKIIDRRAGRIKKGTDQLAKSVQEIDLGVDFEFRAAVEHRGVLVFKDDSLSSKVTDVDPHEVNVPYHISEAISDEKKDMRTAELVNEFTEKTANILGDHPINKKRKNSGELPANIILPRGAGKVPQLESFNRKTGLRGAAISGIPLVKGVCKLTGMDIIDLEGATGGLDADIRPIIDATKKALGSYNFVLVNIKATDILGHDGLAEEKKEFIEKIDHELDTLLDLENTYCVFTGDHSTPVTVKRHSGDPLPITIWGDQVRTDDVEQYGERPCSKGGEGRIRGKDLLNILLDLSGRGEKFGA